MAKRYIDADRLKQTIADNVYPVQDAFNSRDYGMFWTGGIEKAIDEAPAADVQPVRRGRWVDLKCDQCGQVDMSKPNFCPNCGAQMEVE